VVNEFVAQGTQFPSFIKLTYVLEYNPEYRNQTPNFLHQVLGVAKIPHIALLIETSREYGRGLLRGVASYHQEHGPWSIYFEPHGLNDRPPSWLKHWKGDGILARIDDRRMADAILATKLPAVDVRGAFEDLPIPFVGLDNRPIAKLGFEHLQQCGLVNFAFCGTPRGENPNQDRRCDFFVELVAAAGKECEVFLGRSRRQGTSSWEIEQQQIARWLKGLRKPVGVMTCHDDRGHQTLDACRRAGLRVPDEVAVIGVDNDSHLCNMCTPPLSSIDVNPSHIGYEASALLTRLMRGAAKPKGPVLLGPPRGIVPRQSTDVLAIDDHDVAAVLRFVREHAVEGIQVSDVFASARCSTSTLERRIKATLGRTIKTEITRVRLERARLLLQETDLPIAAVATRSGFSEPKYFCEVFRKAEGVTATTYRATYRD
jgi:LacI family transcriptional regulator